MIIEKAKILIRRVFFLEFVFYWIQNNILYSVLNFEGYGNNYNSFQKTCKQVIQISNKYKKNLTIRQANKILEIGVGYSLVPILKTGEYLNSKNIYAFDKNNNLRKNDQIVANYLKIKSKYDMVKYFYGSFDKIISASKKSKFDCVFSNSVLEHVNHLKKLIQRISLVTKKNGYSLHVVDFRNHNRFNQQGTHYFLAFSGKVWRSLGNNVGAPNRIGLSKILKYFLNSGFRILKIKRQLYKKADLDRAIRVCPKIIKYDLETKVAIILAKKN